MTLYSQRKAPLIDRYTPGKQGANFPSKNRPAPRSLGANAKEESSVTTTTSVQLTYSVVQTGKNLESQKEEPKRFPLILDLNSTSDDEDDWSNHEEQVEQKNQPNTLAIQQSPKEMDLEPNPKPSAPSQVEEFKKPQPPPPSAPEDPRLPPKTATEFAPPAQPSPYTNDHSYGPMRTRGTAHQSVVTGPYSRPNSRDYYSNPVTQFYQEYEQNLKNGRIWADRGTPSQRACCVYGCGGIASERLAHCARCIETNTDPFTNPYKKRRHDLSVRLNNYLAARCMDKKTVELLVDSISALTRRISPAELHKLIKSQLQRTKGKTGISMESGIYLLTRLLSNITEPQTAYQFQDAVACYILDFWRIPYGAKDYSNLFKHVATDYNEAIVPKNENFGWDELDAILYFRCPRLRIEDPDPNNIESIVDVRIGNRRGL